MYETDYYRCENWEAICVEWEEDEALPKAKKNPYDTEGLTMTEAEARRQLAADEERRLNAGGTALHATSAPAFITMGLDIEDTQRRLQRLAKKTTATSTARQDGTLIEQRNQLLARIRLWEQLLPIYMPGLLQYHNETHTTGIPEHPEDRTIWLPSSIPTKERHRVCSKALADIEEKLRTAQCYDALDSIRHILKIKSRLVKFKQNNIRGQPRLAKVELTGAGKWEKELQVLNDTDIRGYQDPNHLRQKTGRRGTLEDDQIVQDTPKDQNETPDFTLLPEHRTQRDGTGETGRTLSWIWLTPQDSENPNCLRDDPENAGDDILRAEWSKSRARVNRAREEVLLLREDMRRTLEYLGWRAAWWELRACLRLDVDKVLAEGLKAESEVQADVQRSLAVHFRSIWKDPLGISAEVPAPENPPSVPTTVDSNNPQSSDGNTQVAAEGDKDEGDEEEDEGLEDYMADAYPDETEDDVLDIYA